MAYPGDPTGPVAQGEPSSAGGRLTTDEFDQLASAFRPSWEFDEAPFTGPGNLSPAEIQALQARGGTSADIRAAVPAVTAPTAAAVANGSLHPSVAAPPPSASIPAAPPAVAPSLAAPPPATFSAPAPPPVASLAFSVAPVGASPSVAPAAAPPPPSIQGAPYSNGTLPPPSAAAPGEPAPSVIVERAPTSASVAPAASYRPPPTASVRPGPIDDTRTPLGPPVVVEPPDRMAKTRIVQRPLSAESTASLEIKLTRSKRPLWIGLGVGAVLLAAVGIWVGSSSSSGDDATPPAPSATTAAKTAEPWTPVPPETTTAPVATAAPVLRSQPELTMRPATPTPAAAPPPAAAPARTPTPAPRAYVAPPAPRPAPRPASKPAGGGGSTIVHDVPF